MNRYRFLVFGSVAAAVVSSFRLPSRVNKFVSIAAIGLLGSISHFSSIPIAAAAAATTMSSSTFDSEYPGTAVQRLNSIHSRVASLNSDPLKFSGKWEDVRRNILWAGGLKDLQNASPGAGYTGHSFNDFNHCDLTAMNGEVADSENNNRVAGIHSSNKLGAGIKIASIEELGPGGSWSTCMMGCKSDPPRDVAHVQFNSRVAFKLVWAPPAFESFVLVDDAGKLLASGTPEKNSGLPRISERQRNFELVEGSKYATEAVKFGGSPSCQTDKSC